MLTSLAALTVAQSASAPPAVPRQYPRRTVKSGGGASNRLHDNLVARGREAEAKGDFVLAEALYQQACDLDRRLPFDRLLLAHLYDRQGRDREAFAEYRAVVVGVPYAWSSQQEEPAVLSRFGDLGLRFGTVEEAGRAYTLAASRSNRDDVHEPTTEGRGTTLPALRAAAHTAAGIGYLGTGQNEEAVREFNEALRIVPNFWVALYYRASEDCRTGRMADAARDAARAEALATPKGREQVRWLRYGCRIPDLAGNLLPVQLVPGHVNGAHPPVKPSPVSGVDKPVQSDGG